MVSGSTACQPAGLYDRDGRTGGRMTTTCGSMRGALRRIEIASPQFIAGERQAAGEIEPPDYRPILRAYRVDFRIAVRVPIGDAKPARTLAGNDPRADPAGGHVHQSSSIMP